MSRKVVGGRDSPRIQRSGKGARESPGDSCDHMIQSGRILRAGDLSPMLFFVEAPDAPMDAEVERIGEILDIGRAMGPLQLVNANVARVCYGHDSTSLRKFLHMCHFSFLKWPQAKVMGVSLKTEKRRSHCPVFGFRQWLRRAEGLPGMTTEDLHGNLRRSAPPALLPLVCMVIPDYSSFSVLRETPMTSTFSIQKAKMTPSHQLSSKTR
jgi:hypothetical protein